VSKKKIDPSCPCSSGKTLADCCEPYINGNAPAPSAETLMRSRYTAYVLHDQTYLLDSWHASTRPESIEMDPDIHWIRLKILNSDNDHVEFVATFRRHGKAHKLHENSRFIFEDGRWFYVDGVTDKED
jgi:SEC-C motif-containing protein